MKIIEKLMALRMQIADRVENLPPLTLYVVGVLDGAVVVGIVAAVIWFV